jgi:hypothetical protein
MKKILIVFSLLFITNITFAQFLDTAHLNDYIRNTIKDRRPDKVSAEELQTALLGVTQFLTPALITNEWRTASTNFNLQGAILNSRDSGVIINNNSSNPSLNIYGNASYTPSIINILDSINGNSLYRLNYDGSILYYKDYSGYNYNSEYDQANGSYDRQVVNQAANGTIQSQLQNQDGSMYVIFNDGTNETVDFQMAPYGYYFGTVSGGNNFHNTAEIASDGALYLEYNNGTTNTSYTYFNQSGADIGVTDGSVNYEPFELTSSGNIYGYASDGTNYWNNYDQYDNGGYYHNGWFNNMSHSDIDWTQYDGSWFKNVYNQNNNDLVGVVRQNSYDAAFSIATGNHDSTNYITRMNLSGGQSGTDIASLNLYSTQLKLDPANIPFLSSSFEVLAMDNSTGTVGFTTAATSGWNLTGNYATNPSVDYIGTGDNEDVIFKRSGLVSGKLNADNYQTAFGVNSIPITQTSFGNTAIGTNVLANVTGSGYTGGVNTGVGANALSNVTTGMENTNVGYDAGMGITTGSNNVSIGEESLTSISTGNNNTAIGFHANTDSTNATNAIAIGTYTIASSNQLAISDSINNWKSKGLSKGGTTLNYILTDTTGNGSLSLQPSSLTAWELKGNAFGNTQTHSTQFIGTTDMSDVIFKCNNTLGGVLSYYDANAFWGLYAGDSSEYGTTLSGGGTYMGEEAGWQAVGNYNTAVGFLAFAHGKATGNSALGLDALEFSQGNYNTAMGYGAGRGIASGAYNIVGGFNSMYSAGTYTDSFAVVFGFQAGNTNNNTKNAVSFGTNVYNRTDALSISDSIHYFHAGGLAKSVVGYVLTDTSGNGDLLLKAPLQLTTTGTGAATYTSGVLNIPNLTASTWNTTGNTLLSRSSNFIGSTDTSRVTFKTKNLNAGYIDSLQNWNIQDTSAQLSSIKMAIGGTLKVGSYTQGSVRAGSSIVTDGVIITQGGIDLHTPSNTGGTQFSGIRLKGNFPSIVYADIDLLTVGYTGSLSSGNDFTLGLNTYSAGAGPGNVNIYYIAPLIAPTASNTVNYSLYTARPNFNGSTSLFTTGEIHGFFDSGLVASNGTPNYRAFQSNTTIGYGFFQKSSLAKNYFAGSTLMGTAGTPNAADLLDMESTTQAFHPPAMTQTQRDAISSPHEGSEIYNTTTHKYNFYNGTAWIQGGTTSGSVSITGTSTTTFTVTIGQTMPNNIYKAFVQPTSTLALGGYVTNKTATTFDYVVPSATGSVTFDWNVQQ